MSLFCLGSCHSPHILHPYYIQLVLSRYFPAPSIVACILPFPSSISACRPEHTRQAVTRHRPNFLFPTALHANSKVYNHTIYTHSIHPSSIYLHTTSFHTEYIQSEQITTTHTHSRLIPSGPFPKLIYHSLRLLFLSSPPSSYSASALQQTSTSISTRHLFVHF